METRVCSVCLVEKPLVPYKFVNKKWSYMDETGRRWVHHKCSICYEKARRATNEQSVKNRTGRYTWMGK